MPLAAEPENAPHTQPLPSYFPAASRAASPAASPPVKPPAAGPCLEIPLQPIAERLPSALRSRMTRMLDANDRLSLPLATALEQLPQGAVKLSFRELRERSAPGLFSRAGESDDLLVEVPLVEVLSRLNPNHLRRRPEQKRVTVNAGVSAVFTSRSPAAVSSPAHAAAAAAAPAPTPKPARAEALARDEAAASRVMATALPTRPHQPTGTGAHSQPLPRTLAPHVAPEFPALSLSFEAPESPVAAPRVKTNDGSAAVEPVKVALVSLARNWPEPMRREVMGTHLSASVHIPFDELENAMKRGRALFTWKQLRLWITPKPAMALAEHDATSLELPLAVLTPLFLARRSDAGASKKLALNQEIPDVFLVRKPGETGMHGTAVPAAAAIDHAPEAQNVKQPASDPFALSQLKLETSRPAPSPAPGQPDTLTMARSSPLPTQLVQKACHLSGVSGALVATADGLIIASQLPAGMSAETAAAFLPQIFTRLGQYTRELKLGDPTQVELLVGNIPLLIFRVGTVFFAALGKAADPLPKLQLGALANQLCQPTH